MFESDKKEVDKVLNPLNVTKTSMIEFNVGELRNTGLYRFGKIVEFTVENRKYVRYLIYSKLENKECIFDCIPNTNQQNETFVFQLLDTVPFSEEFLDVVGQRFLTTPDDNEYQRIILPNNEERLDGISASIKIYDIETEEIETYDKVKIWDYQRQVDGMTGYLNIEMSDHNGLFKIFKGEMIEEIFYKFYQGT